MSGDTTSVESATMDPGYEPRVRHDVVFRQLQDEWVVFDPVVEKIHVLNLTAALVWVHCDGATRLDEIARSVGESFDDPVDEATVLKDTYDAVANFQSLGLLL